MLVPQLEQKAAPGVKGFPHLVQKRISFESISCGAPTSSLRYPSYGAVLA